MYLSHTPLWLQVQFIVIVAVACYLAWRAVGRNRFAWWVLLPWIVLQAWLSGTGFYFEKETLPPRPIVMMMPLLAIIVRLVATRRRFYVLPALRLDWLNGIHVLRLPVELVIWQLYQLGLMPRLMTFAGGNYDIIIGITAPFILYYGLMEGRLSRAALIAWNVLGLALLLNVLVSGVISFPWQGQLVALDQPNRAVGYWPYVLLPAVVVPLALFAHVATLMNLLAVKEVGQLACVRRG